MGGGSREEGRPQPHVERRLHGTAAYEDQRLVGHPGAAVGHAKGNDVAVVAAAGHLAVMCHLKAEPARAPGSTRAADVTVDDGLDERAATGGQAEVVKDGLHVPGDLHSRRYLGPGGAGTP